ncbi:MipA/OmpV family protein [Rubritalea tangerina]|uniref:MipA/OmpV family protein n=1 Tax=Rubritalea tangerina TaxID=430798 RepID=A0ABW4Z7M3_9BACT
MKATHLTLTALSVSSLLIAGETPSLGDDRSKEVIEISTGEDLLPEWGVAMGVRYAHIPFAAKDKTSSDIFPLFYYEGERFFLRGDYGGIKLWEGEKYGFNALARYRFFDIPEEYDENVRGGAVDMGLQAFWKLDEESQLQFDVLSDPQGRFHSVARWAGDYRRENWRFFPELELRFTGSEFNSHYYGVDLYDLNEGIEARARLKARRRVIRNLHLEGRVEGAWIGSEAKNRRAIEDDFEYEFYLGLGIYDEEPGESSSLNAKPYWRIAQGWGTSSDFQNMILGELETVDGADVNMTSIFYGHPLADSIFGVPIEMYLTPGVAYHYSSNVQDASFEWILAFKAYYTFPTPWRLRLGLAEGISYADSITFYEKTELAEKGYRESKLLNYLDLSLDLNIGDVFKSEKLEQLWLGTAIHHRSGIYESSSAFGSISGGTNFANLYLQWHGEF